MTEINTREENTEAADIEISREEKDKQIGQLVTMLFFEDRHLLDKVVQMHKDGVDDGHEFLDLMLTLIEQRLDNKEGVPSVSMEPSSPGLTMRARILTGSITLCLSIAGLVWTVAGSVQIHWAFWTTMIFLSLTIFCSALPEARKGDISEK